MDLEQVKKLRAIAASHSRYAASTVKVMGLDEIKDHYGDDWPEIKQRVFKHAQYAIDRTLGKADVSIRVKEEGFFFMFANPDPKYSEAQSQKLAEAIRERLFGVDSAIASRLDTAIRSFTFDRESLGSVIQDPSTLFSTDPVHSDEAEKETASTPHLVAQPEARTLFCPVWDVEKGVVIEFMAQPSVAVKCTGYYRNSFGSAGTVQARKAALEADIETINVAAVELGRLIASNSRMIVTACIAASSFCTLPFTTAITSAIRAIPEDYRRLLRCIVYENRLGSHAEDVESAARSLKSLCRTISLCTTIDDMEMMRARELGFHSIGLDLNSYRHIPERAIMPKLEIFAKSARKAKLDFFVSGVHSRSLSSFVVCSGAASMSGDVVGPQAEGTSVGVKYETFDLYETLLSG